MGTQFNILTAFMLIFELGHDAMCLICKCLYTMLILVDFTTIMTAVLWM